MHPSGSHIKSAVEEVRQLLNEATFDAKYDDSYLVRGPIMAAFRDLVSKANSVNSSPTFVRYQLSLVEGQEFYLLPPCIQQVYKIEKRDDSGFLTWDWKPRCDFNPRGPGWALEGSTLRVYPFPTEDDTCDIWYVPSGCGNMHYADNGTVLDTIKPSLFYLSAAPSLGLLGLSENEYAGWTLRVLDTGIHAERIITGYDPNRRECILRNPLPFLTGTTLKYEVIPQGMGPFWPAAASWAAIRSGVGRKISQSQMANLVMQHRGDLKTLRDTLAAYQGRVTNHMERDTMDNPDSAFRWERDTNGWFHQ